MKWVPKLWAALLAAAIISIPATSEAQDPTTADLTEEVAPADPAPDETAAPATPAAAEAPSADPAPPSSEEAKPEATADAKPAADAEPDEAAGLLGELKETTKAFDEYRGATDPSAKKLLFFTLLLVGTNLVLSAFKRGVGLTGRGKKILPWAALGAGVATGLLSELAAGEPTLIAILYGMGPPGAVLAQELFGLIRSKGAGA